MPYYKVLGGSHTEENKTYRQGEVFNSQHSDLETKFRNKFLRANALEIRAAKKKQIEEEEAAKAQAEEEAKLEAKATKNMELDDDVETEDEEQEGSVFGDDVTSEFDGADEAEVKVFKKGRHYTVANADTPDKAVRGGKELTKTKVREYIQAHTPEEEQAEAEEEAAAEDED